MRKLTRLWQSLEKIPGLAQVPAAWEVYCRPDYDLIRPHLRATNTIGVLYPCPHPSPGFCPRKIVDYGDGTFAALCRDPHEVCPTVPLTSKDVVVHELDVGSFTRMLAELLGIRWQPPEERAGHAWGIGLSKRRRSLNQPVFFAAAFGQSEFRSTVLELLANVPGPFVLVAPTDRHRDVSLQEHFERRGIGFVSLEEQVLLDDEGKLTSVDPLESGDDLPPTPVEDRQRLMDAFRAKYDCTAPTIADEAEVHIRDLYKWIAGEIKDASKKSKRIEAVLRQGLPAHPGR
jgi:hypothetical protein